MKTGPNNPCQEEAKVLDAPHIAFIKRGARKTPGELLEAVRDADVAICWHESYTRVVLANAHRFKAVIRTGVGVDKVDSAAAT